MAVGSMTPKERFIAALNGQPVDRPCAASITSVVNFELMDLVGRTRSGSENNYPHVPSREKNSR